MLEGYVSGIYFSTATFSSRYSSFVPSRINMTSSLTFLSWSFIFLITLGLGDFFTYYGDTGPFSSSDSSISIDGFLSTFFISNIFSTCSYFFALSFIARLLSIVYESSFVGYGSTTFRGLSLSIGGDTALHLFG